MSYSFQALSILGFLLSACFYSCGMAHAEETEVIGYDQVKQILRKRCVTCHNPDELRGDLDLKDLNAIRAGSGSGDVVVPGDPNASLLYTTVAHLEDPTMPPNSPPIPAREQDLIRRWIEGGLAEKSGSVKATNPANEMDRQQVGRDPDPSSESVVMNSAESSSAGSSLSAVRAVPRATAVTTLASHPSQDLAALAGLQQVVLFAPSRGELLGALDIPGLDVTALKFSSSGELLLVAAGTPALSGSVYAFDVATGRQIWQVGDETDSILSMDLSPDGQTLAVGGPSKTVRLYNVPRGEILHSLKKHTDWVLSVRFSPDGLLLASSDRFGGIFVWEPKAANVFHALKDHEGPVHALAWDSDSETLISAGEDAKIRTWNLHHGQLTSSWDAQVGPILSIVRGAGFIAATGRKGGVSLWNQPEVLAQVHELQDQGEALSLTHDGAHLLVGDASGKISILRTQDFSLAATASLPQDPSSLQELFARLEVAKEEFAIQQKNEMRLARSQETNNLESSIAPEPPLKPAAAPSSQTAINLPTDTELYQSHLQVLEKSIQQSNETLIALATISNQLVDLLQKTSQTQAELAKSIADQTELLERMRVGNQQLQQAGIGETGLK
ncbi:MAG: hypothetical protein NXI32_00930 [bacterium]|nr:hypothetical protein [bacterium]